MQQGKWLIVPRNTSMKSNITQQYPGWYPVPRRTYQLMRYRKRSSYFASRWTSVNIRSRLRQATHSLNSNHIQVKAENQRTVLNIFSLSHMTRMTSSQMLGATWVSSWARVYWPSMTWVMKTWRSCSHGTRKCERVYELTCKFYTELYLIRFLNVK